MSSEGLIWDAATRDCNTLSSCIQKGDGAYLVRILHMAQVEAAKTSAALMEAELRVKLAEALAYNEGKVVGANKESRDASAMGFTAAERKHVIECKLAHDLDEALVESCKQAIKLVAAQGDSSELIRLREENQQQAQELMDLAAKYDSLEKLTQEMDAQLSDEQRKMREEGPFGYGF